MQQGERKLSKTTDHRTNESRSHSNRSKIVDICETTEPRLHEHAGICSASSPLSVRASIYTHICKESSSLWWVSVSVSPPKRAGRCRFNLRSWPSARLPEEQSARFKLAANGLAAPSRRRCHPAAAGRRERGQIERERESRSQAGGSSSSLRRPEETALPRQKAAAMMNGAQRDQLNPRPGAS